MATSANVIEYRIEKGGKVVGHHREHIMCNDHYEELLKFEPLSEHAITPFGYDEEEDYWEGETKNLEVYLMGMKCTNKVIKEYFIRKALEC